MDLMPKPRPRPYLLYIAVSLLIVIGVGGLWYVYKYVLTNSSTTTVVDQVKVPPQAESINQSEIYYTTRTRSEGSNEFFIYNFSPSLNNSDPLVIKGTNPYINIQSPYIEPGTFYADTNTGYQLVDVQKKQISNLFNFPEGASYTRHAALSHSKKYLAYGIDYEGENGGSEVWLYDVDTKQSSLLVKKTNLGLYQGYSILGWSGDDSYLIASAIGGDAGAVWGDWYTIDVQTGGVSKLDIPESQQTAFAKAILSPDSSQLAYYYCPNPGAETSEGLPSIVECPQGEELFIYDIANRRTRSVYRNTRYDNNTNSAVLRSFMSIVWQDDNTVMAAVPGAFLKINVQSGAHREVYTYDQSNPALYKDMPIQLHHADDKHILYTRYNGSGGSYVYNLDSNKITQVGSLDSTETYFGQFFVGE